MKLELDKDIMTLYSRKCLLSGLCTEKVALTQVSVCSNGEGSTCVLLSSLHEVARKCLLKWR